MTITLKKGDYVLIAGMTPYEVENVIKAFIKAGATMDWYGTSSVEINDNVLGWDARDGDVYAWKNTRGPVFGKAFTGRRLTYENIMQAGEGSEEIKQQRDDLYNALKELMSDIGGGKKACGHDFDCICAKQQAKEILEELKNDY